MARASSARTLDRLPHPGRGGRHVDVRHAERCERIQDGVDDGARRADGGALAGALDAERVRRARHVAAGDGDRRQIVGARDGVVQERPGQQLSARRVVDALLGQRLADALRCGAVHLAVHDHRVHRAARVVDHRPRGDRDGSGLGIDLELADLAPVRKRERPVLVHRCGRERGPEGAR